MPHVYPDGSARALREAIAALHNLNAEHIVCGAGSDEILQLLARAYVGEGDNVIQSQYGFLVYALATKACGAEIRFAPERNFTTDIEAILDLVDARTRIVFLANPNNPTGTYIPESDLRELRNRLRGDILLVVDAAYAEFVDAADYEPGERLVAEYDNVVSTRTFSKIYGLAGLRLGWGYFPPAIADVVNRIRGPFNVSAAAIAAGVAAVGDQAFIDRNREHNAQQKAIFEQRLGGLGLDYLHSHGNFILVRLGAEADAAHEFLKRRGVLVRDMKAYGLPEFLRISIGPAEANCRCLDILTEFFEND